MQIQQNTIEYSGKNIQKVWDSVKKDDREWILSELKDVLTDFGWQKIALGLETPAILNEKWSDMSPDLQGLIVEFHKLNTEDPDWAGLDIAPLV